MTPSKLTEKIAIACDEVRKELPKPQPKGPNWSPHKSKRDYRKIAKRLINAASKKHGIDPDRVTKIIFKE